MSAFLFKQTETAGKDCACGARTFGRGTGPAPRARLRRAGRKAGGARGLADERGRLAAGRADRVRQAVYPLP